ncbi:GNAT family N-acetyltransferase [Clostridium sp. FP1]|uniref:GNAT family N-acetyltransferase n=1 Tax=Clostridium sp. FP1 TaxID=2724076 RepID=UPI0013E91FB2|nr:GNAT family N-acetyltransferase [Clostridium sp. FP1]MBZ9637485.1 GNAT family N-acetyltransferase [Clostridium sp. FP1]
MIFQSKGFYIDLVQNKDLKDIVEVYNSNKYFLTNHMDTDIIKYEWILEELASMKKADFYSCKVVEKSPGKIIGIIDFKIGEETYLSLLMIHNDYKNKGFGRLIYQALEEYITSVKSKCMRIDVVINYDDSVLKFWVKNGFSKIKDIELNWTGKILPAIIMKKFL